MSKPTILIVDDEPFNIEICKAYLEDQFIIEEAGSGPECMAFLANQPTPDLILMDWMMPNPNGLECTSLIRQDEKLKPTPVVIVSAKGNSDEIAYARTFPIDDFLVKPFEEDELVAMVHKHLKT